ncbi:unnamed protein product [marine sediment metagenome]|uniref:Citrate transporter-like domain-containing protein n=1 Tax=marine sediment metagenome TaxID=412755 RepID=X0W832_9ZZZZ
MSKLKLPRGEMKKAFLWIGIAVLVCIIILLLPTPEGLPLEGHRFLALLILVLILWVSEAVPIGITALLVAGGLILLGVQNPSDAWMPWGTLRRNKCVLI